MKEFPLQLLDDLLVVRPEDTSSAVKGIILPDWSRTLRGPVLAVGPGCQVVKKLDNIVFGAATGMESVFDGVAVRIMREGDVDAVLE